MRRLAGGEQCAGRGARCTLGLRGRTRGLKQQARGLGWIALGLGRGTARLGLGRGAGMGLLTFHILLPRHHHLENEGPKSKVNLQEQDEVEGQAMRHLFGMRPFHNPYPSAWDGLTSTPSGDSCSCASWEAADQGPPKKGATWKEFLTPSLAQP